MNEREIFLPVVKRREPIEIPDRGERADRREADRSEAKDADD
jgi:hypothetical protein